MRHYTSNNYYLHSGNDYLITNCTFVHNIADDFAGAVDGCDNHKATLLNCRFNGNLASNGGAMSCGYGCEMTLINNTFCGNRATSYGGALHVNHESEAYVINCILWGDEVYDNNPVHGNEVAVIDDSTLEISYSVLAGGYSDAFIGPDSLLIINSSVVDYDPHYIAEGSWTGGNQYNWFDSAWVWNDGCYELTSFLSSLHVIDTGNNALVPLDIYDVDGDDDYNEPTPDLSHHDRIAQCYVDMGAYEYTLIGDILPDGHVDLSDLAIRHDRCNILGRRFKLRRRCESG